MNVLDSIADRWYGTRSSDDSSTRHKVSLGVHRLGFRRGWGACLVSVAIVYGALRALGLV